jgi:acetyl esterase/lipase
MEMALKQRIDPEVAEGLEAFEALLGPGGLNAIADVGERRAAFDGLIAGLVAGLPPNDRVSSEDMMVPGPAGAPDVRVRVYRPVDAATALPGILYIHGGGMVLGSIETEDPFATLLTDRLGCVTVSVDYRLAPEHPHPAPVEDCYAALSWTAGQATELGIDPHRLAVYGPSAGGGLAAGVALLARDRGGPRLAYQVLIQPMLDDRNETASSREIVDLGVWDRATNLEAWRWLLGDRAGTDEVDEYAAPARARDLSGLPPTYIDVGDLDLFRDEDIDYATRLMRAGVPTELHVYPGAVHGSEIFAPASQLATRIIACRMDALRHALLGDRVRT